MATACTAPVNSIATTSCPWRRGPQSAQAKQFSTNSQEFVPKSLSANSPDFVPSWKKGLEESIVAEATDSESSEEEFAPMRFSAKSREFIPKAFNSEAKEFVPKALSAQSQEFVPKSFSAKAEEFISAAISFDAYSDPSDDEDIDEGSDVSQEPVGKPMQSLSRTWSKCTGSTMTDASTSLSADDASSTASQSGMSRSQSPAPSTPEVSADNFAAPFDLRAMLQWRYAAPSDHPDCRLPGAEAVPGTSEAVAAAAAKAAASSKPEPASLSPKHSSFPSPKRFNDLNGYRRTEDLASVKPIPQEKSMWRDVAPVKKLEVSEESWAARQRARRSTRNGSNTDKMSNEDVVRAMKSILNKLTVEKFDSLSAQLMNCGIRSALHLECLIEEIFEKACTQHHFIDMYADLCTLLNQHRIIDDSKVNFKKILLNCCQASFEKNLTPPSGLSEMTGEARAASELMYKMRMLGNIRFVGALLVRKMLASKVMLSIMEVLLQEPSPESLESLAAFLMVVGPTFDTPDWAYRTTLNAVFTQVGQLIKKGSIPSRIQCLLKDVLDVRNLGWQDRRPKKIEGPLKLDQVAAKAAVESGGGKWDANSQAMTGDTWAVVGGTRLGKTSSHPGTPVSASSLIGKLFPGKAEKTATDSDLFKKARERVESTKKEAKGESKRESKREAVEFDKEACRAEVVATLAELRVSHDVPDAIARMADIHVPVPSQASELCHILAAISEEGSQAVRKLGFELAAGLFLGSHWKPESAAKGIHSFVEDTCADLKYDVPTLPTILRDELHPALAPLRRANLLDVEDHDCLLSL